MYAISPKNEEIASKYLLQLLLSATFTRYVVDCSMRVAMPKVNREALGDCWLSFPGRTEQERVLEVIDQETRPLAMQVSRFQKTLILITEYRARVIADVVTGELNVQNHPWSAKPLEIPEQVPTEDSELEELANAD